MKSMTMVSLAVCSASSVAKLRGGGHLAPTRSTHAHKPICRPRLASHCVHADAIGIVILLCEIASNQPIADHRLQILAPKLTSATCRSLSNRTSRHPHLLLPLLDQQNAKW